MDILHRTDESARVSVSSLQKQILQITSLGGRIADSYKNGGKVIAFGNGGSLADAMHFAGELEGAYRNRTRPGVAALVPSNPVTLTAIANDFGFEKVFSKFVEANASPKDIIFGISTSGGSRNVLEGLREAGRKGCYCVALTGERGLYEPIADLELKAYSTDTPTIQETHMLMLHEIAGLVEAGLFGNGSK
jgi:D-sedoheptulose 7-phosphate isomerase